MFGHILRGCIIGYIVTALSMGDWSLWMQLFHVVWSILLSYDMQLFSPTYLGTRSPWAQNKILHVSILHVGHTDI
jgi:hypothetical protein